MGEDRTGTMRTRLELGTERPGLRLGFTLIELMVVMAIIGIIITFLLVAASDSRLRAEEDATLALITKLEGGINDRLDALLQTRPDPNPAHFYMAGIYPSGNTLPQSPASARAQVFAWYDYIKSELPDVFFVQNFNPGQYDYPLNFAANSYPGTPIDSLQSNRGNFMLPLGNGVANAPAASTPSYGAGNLGQPMGTGIYGASYFAASGLYKNLGYLPTGYDGIDNDGDGYVDNWAEGVGHPPSFTADSQVVATVQANLTAHQHHTARAEALYAILVEGVGPLGSVFIADDFTDREVKDTDGDGLPEFVDAWGQPLQFFRWPLLYHTDSQKGQVIDYVTSPPPLPLIVVEVLNPPYRSVFEAREQDSLDPNQQLMAPAWWWSGANPSSPFGSPPGPLGQSGGVLAFEAFFHRLTEPLAHTGASQFYWDRGANFPARRAFLTKPLILSGGPDQQPGVFLYQDTPGSSPCTALQLLAVESNAMPYIFDFTATAQVPVPGMPQTFPNGTYISSTPPTPTVPNPSYPTYQLRENGRDDISNQNRQATGGPGGS